MGWIRNTYTVDEFVARIERTISTHLEYMYMNQECGTGPGDVMPSMYPETDRNIVSQCNAILSHKVPRMLPTTTLLLYFMGLFCVIVAKAAIIETAPTEVRWNTSMVITSFAVFKAVESWWTAPAVTYRRHLHATAELTATMVKAHWPGYVAFRVAGGTYPELSDFHLTDKEKASLRKHYLYMHVGEFT